MIRRSILALALVGLAACEFPTEPPRWDQTWVVPGDSITVSVAELLPTSVGLSDDSTAFEAVTPATSGVFSLSQMCPECSAFNGTTVAKPEFDVTLNTAGSLPADLVAATLAGGSLSATLEHNLSFDPLRPSTDPDSPRGHMVIRVTSAGNTVAYDSISGYDRAFPAGTPITPTLAIQPVVVTDSLGIAISLYSPAGDPTEIDTSDTLGITVAESTVRISEATINVSDVTIDPVTTPMDFAGVDSTLVERIQSGALLLDVTNPFSINGTLDVAFQDDFPSIQRSLTVVQGSYPDSLTFSGPELQAILGSDAVDVVASGTVTAPDGTVTVTPTQRLVLDTGFRLVVLIGPTEEL